MNPVLSEILETRKVLKPDGSSTPFDYAVSAEEGAAMQRLIRETRPRVTLEVGCAYGISTLYICEALAEVGGERHIVIDPLQEDGWGGVGLFTARRAGFGDLIEFVGKPSHVALPALVARDQRVGFALIDGWHTFDYVMVDFFYVDLLLTVGGIVMFDDTRSYPAIRKIARYVATHRNYTPLQNEQNGLKSEGSKKRRMFNAAINAGRAALGVPLLRPLTRHILRPDLLHRDEELGLPPDNFIAFRKTADDALGDGSNRTRRWDQHIDF